MVLGAQFQAGVGICCMYGSGSTYKGIDSLTCNLSLFNNYFNNWEYAIQGSDNSNLSFQSELYATFVNCTVDISKKLTTRNSNLLFNTASGVTKMTAGYAEVGNYNYFNYGSSSGVSHLVIDSNGYIGIGTNTPTSRLTITDGTTSAEGITAVDGITFGTDTNLYRSSYDELSTDDVFYINNVSGLKLLPQNSTGNILLQADNGTETSAIWTFPFSGDTVMGTNSPQTVTGLKTFSDSKLKLMSGVGGKLGYNSATLSVAAPPTASADFVVTIPADTGTILLDSSTFTRYSLPFYGIAFNPADGQTYYIGSRFSVAPSTTSGICKVYIPCSGTVKRISVYAQYTTGASSETGTAYFRYDNTTDTSIGSMALNAATNTGTYLGNYTLNIAVTAGHYFEIKFVAPTWTTNPTDVIFSGNVYIE
jgi:hypothetical protein